MNDRRLRILVVNWQDRENPQAGGAEAHLHETFGRLAARGHAVTLLVSGWSGAPTREFLDGMEVHRTGGRYTFSAAAPLYARRHLQAHTFDVVVEDLNKVPLFTPFWVRTPVALLVHHLFGATAFQEAALPLAAATWVLERPVPRVFCRRPTVAVSESTREDLIRRGMDPDRIEVIPNGVDLDRYTPDPEGVRYDEPTILYLGRLKRYKGVDLVLAAVRALVARGTQVRFLIGGKGDDRPRLERLTRTMGLEGHVRFLGFVSEEEKLELLRRSWIHTLTSPKEGWGISNMEAAACGTPTVASDAPGLRESVVPGKTGLLAPHGDVPALAEALGTLLEDAPLREEMGRNARAFAEEFSWDRTADRMEEFLFRVVGSARPD
ncbi:MAG: glycosyltransferase family 4 protein [Gemmatimonadota bacterium]